MLRFQVEQFADITHELPPLFERHFDEIALDKELIPLAPDWDTYLKIESEGQLFVLTARDGQRLAGYFVAQIGRGLHNARSRMAKTDMYYLLPEYRRGMNGVRLIREAMDRMDFDKMIIQTKLDHDYSPLFKRLGFTPVETVFTRVR